MFKIFKFGGSSIKGYDDIKYIARIISSFKSKKLIIVFSAIETLYVWSLYWFKDKKRVTNTKIVKYLLFNIFLIQILDKETK